MTAGVKHIPGNIFPEDQGMERRERAGVRVVATADLKRVMPELHDVPQQVLRYQTGQDHQPEHHRRYQTGHHQTGQNQQLPYHHHHLGLPL